MACPTGRCALRRFDGHGSGSYRPINKTLANENETRLANLLANRESLDSLFTKPDRLPETSLAISLASLNPITGVLVREIKNTLPDSKPTGITPWKTPSASSFTKKNN
jgi:hypothetical protein